MEPAPKDDSKEAAPAPVELKPVEKELPAPAAVAAGKATTSIVFKATETSVPLSTKPELDTLAKTLKTDSARVNLLAYASGSEDQASTARRVSLSRALAVRAYLIEQGVDKLSINVHAEGNKNPGGDPDRVDIFVEKGEKK